MDPANIRFTQDSINGRYEDMCEAMLNGAQMPAVRVFRQNGQWHSLDNRRLAAHLQLGERSIRYERVYLSHGGGHMRDGSSCSVREDPCCRSCV